MSDREKDAPVKALFDPVAPSEMHPWRVQEVGVDEGVVEVGVLLEAEEPPRPVEVVVIVVVVAAILVVATVVVGIGPIAWYTPILHASPHFSAPATVIR